MFGEQYSCALLRNRVLGAGQQLCIGHMRTILEQRHEPALLLWPCLSWYSDCSKRMEATPKLTLIQQLGVVPVCARWQSGLPNVEEEPELAVKYAR